MDNQKAAYILYKEDWTGKRIAAAFGVSEQTVVDWKKKGRWEEKKVTDTLARETAEDSLWELINYQLEELKKLKNQWASEGSKKVHLIEKGDIDALTKMFSAVKGKQLEWSNYVKIAREIVDHLRSENSALAKSIVAYIDVFLNQKRKEL